MRYALIAASITAATMFSSAAGANGCVERLNRSIFCEVTRNETIYNAAEVHVTGGGTLSLNINFVDPGPHSITVGRLTLYHFDMYSADGEMIGGNFEDPWIDEYEEVTNLSQATFDVRVYTPSLIFRPRTDWNDPHYEVYGTSRDEMWLSTPSAFTWSYEWRGDGTTLSLAVPEPASWAMLITGFGLIGGTLRARARSKLERVKGIEPSS